MERKKKLRFRYVFFPWEPSWPQVALILLCCFMFRKFSRVRRPKKARGVKWYKSGLYGSEEIFLTPEFKWWAEFPAVFSHESDFHVSC